MSTAPAVEVAPLPRVATSYAPEFATGAVILLGDILALMAASAIAIGLRQYSAATDLWPGYLRLLPLLGAIPVLFALMDLYPSVLLNPVEELRRVTIAITFGMSLVLLATYLVRQANAYSRAVYLMAGPLSVLSVMATRVLVRRIASRSRWWGIPAVLMGSRDDIDSIARKISANPAAGIRVAGLHVLSGADALVRARPPGRAPVFPDAPYAIVVVPPDAGIEWLRRAERMVWGCRRFLLVPRSLGMLSPWMTVRECRGLVGFEVRRELLKPSSRAIKRTLDLCLTVAAGFVILPLVALIAAAIRINTRGPIFYTQERIGQGGRRFRAWKFRTMVPGAGRILEECLARNPRLRAEWETGQKLRHDPRITTVGRFLRFTSLDELPQLWNVVKGEMSLVGPRPIIESEVSRYGDLFDLFCAVRPGLTGLWQVSGRSNLTYQERVAMDAHYVRNWSVWFDLYVLARTVVVVLTGEGAY